MVTLSEHLIVEHSVMSPVLQIMVWKVLSCGIMYKFQVREEKAKIPILLREMEKADEVD